MALFEEASPICRGKNLSWDTILLFYNNMPREAMPKAEFNSYTESRINAWTQTHSQIARQLAFYYEENGICYPRFTKELSYQDLFAYMQNWAMKYFIPNPYAPSLKDFKPTCIYASIVNAIKLGQIDFDTILDSMFGVKLSSHDKVNVYLSNFTNLLIDNNKNVSINERTKGKSVVLHPDIELATDPKKYFDYFSLETDRNTFTNISSFEEKYNFFFTAIRTKPFLLLAGISGTGKSRIVRELAFMTCPKELQDEDGTTPGNYCMIEVKPNWHDSSELLGYYSSFNGGGYRFTKFDRFVVKAWLNPDVTFFVCLDEMNLAPVEQYFAEFLSVLETRSRDNEGNVVTGALVDKQYFKDDTKMSTELGLDKGDDWTIKVRSDLVNKGLTLPPNLIVIGTVNMDDTTYQFSRKVIDRAMTIEMNGGELSQMFGNSNSLKYRSDEDVVKLGLFKAPYINADEVIERYQSQAQIIKEKLPKKLEAVNTALKDTPFQVSYRVLNELVIYLGVLMDEATAKGEAIDDDALPALIDQAMDQITLMKILPRIEGDEDMFRRSEGLNVLKTLQSLFSEDTDSYRKLEEMTDRLGRTGFTRFWP